MVPESSKVPGSPKERAGSSAKSKIWLGCLGSMIRLAMVDLLLRSRGLNQMRTHPFASGSPNGTDAWLTIHSRRPSGSKTRPSDRQRATLIV